MALAVCSWYAFDALRKAVDAEIDVLADGALVCTHKGGRQAVSFFGGILKALVDQSETHRTWMYGMPVVSFMHARQ